MRERRELIFREGQFEEYEVFDAVITGASSLPSRVERIISPPMRMEDPGAGEKLSQMVQETASLKKLEHRNLVKLLDISGNLRDFVIKISMEYFKYHSLEKTLTAGVALCEVDIRLYSEQINLQICSALAYLHQHNVIHRNVNSKTVVISDENVVKLIDYGIAIQLLDNASRHRTGCARGEPQFMAPELCQSQPDPSGQTKEAVFMCGPESDIWAFGCVVFHMATGRRPLAECGNMGAIVKKVCYEDPPALSNTCSSAIRSFHACCVVRERRERSSAMQLLKHEFIDGHIG